MKQATQRDTKHYDALNERYCRAAGEGRIDDVRRYLQDGADPNATLNDTPAIILAVRGGHVRTMKVIVDVFKGRLDAQDGKTRNTAFMEAAIHNKQSCFLELGVRGAKLDIVNKNGKTGADLTREAPRRIRYLSANRM